MTLRKSTLISKNETSEFYTTIKKKLVNDWITLVELRTKRKKGMDWNYIHPFVQSKKGTDWIYPLLGQNILTGRFDCIV